MITTTNPNRNEGTSQCAFILAHLRAFGSITPYQALDHYGCFRLAARIADLRSQGHKIRTDIIQSGKKRWAIYRFGQ